MALRYLSRRFAIPAFAGLRDPVCQRQRALDLPPPAPLSNGDAAWKQCHEEKERAELLAKYRATIEATEAALRKAEKMDKLKRQLDIASFVVSFSLAVYTVVVIDRKYGYILRRRVYNREAKMFNRANIDEADRDEDDI